MAFIACHHQQFFSLFDAGNDRETSHFLEEISNFEAEILDSYFQMNNDMKKKFGGFTGEMIITNDDAEIIHHEKPVCEVDIGIEKLKERAKRGSREKFLKALSKVPKIEPAEEDKID